MTGLRRATLVIALALAALAAVLLVAHADRTIARDIARWRGGGVVDVCTSVALVGDYTWAVLVALVVAALVAPTVGRAASLRIPLAVLVAIGAATVLKGLVDRARPPASLAAHHLGGASFPSGHATDSAALAAAAILVLGARGTWWVAWVAVPAAVAVSATRPCLGVHYLSDVLAGAALGILCALAVTANLPDAAPPPAEPPGSQQ